MKLKPIKVSELNSYINRIIISDPVLYNISVEGEISNYKYHNNGNTYFTLKDKKSKIKCVMFKENSSNLKIAPKDGMKVVACGHISIYEREGIYQILVKNIKLIGLGQLYEQFEKLKKKLLVQGLFDEENKQSIPFMPMKVGVITSSTVAAVRDIIKVIKRRCPITEILIYPVLVQGQKAHCDLCKALDYFNLRKDIDLIIIGRGGGSIEELWAFNEEDVARAIYKISVPVISAVGHETDFTIADFVADMRAATPSVAGEMAVPNIKIIKERLEFLLKQAENNFTNNIDKMKNKLKKIKDSNFLKKPEKIINDKKEKLDLDVKYLSTIKDKQMIEYIKKLEYLNGKLKNLNPEAVLNRGYTIITNENQEIIKSAAEIKRNQKLNIILSDGEIKVLVTDTDRR